MNKLIIVKIIAGFAFLVGIAVMLGWYLDIGILKSILPVWPSMKFTTAICFSLSGVILFFMVRIIEGEVDLSRLMVSVAAFTILLIVLTSLFSSLLGISTGMEYLFVKESSIAIQAVGSGLPSLGTAVDFILIAFTGFLIILHPRRYVKILVVIGCIVSVIGLSAITGYIMNIPGMYYLIEDVSNGMAMHTAIVFVLFGFGFILLAKDQ